MNEIKETNNLDEKNTLESFSLVKLKINVNDFPYLCMVNLSSLITAYILYIVMYII